MTVAAPQLIQLTCPQCGTPMRAEVHTIIDVGRQPELKDRLLSGQLNIAVCPKCGTPAMLSAPLIYHDATKQLYLTFFPQQLNARPEEQERFIGDATNLIMRNLPPDAPRAHLLAPKRFLTLNTLMETVLEADGITKAMLDQQRQRVALISMFAEAFAQGDERLLPLVEQRRADLTPEFFATLVSFANASAQAGRRDTAALLAGLYQRLMELTGGAPDEDDTNVLDDPQAADAELAAAVDRLMAAEDAEVEPILAELRPLIDYEFFVIWTSQIEAAQAQGNAALVERLTARRAMILETVEKMDQQAQAMFERASRLMNEILSADDVSQALHDRIDQVDEAFMLVLDAQIEAAQHAGRTEIAERLAGLRQMALDALQATLSPEDRLINELMQAETPQAATRMLRQNPAMITPVFVKRLNELADEFEKSGRKPSAERLRQLGREAGAMLF